MTNAFDTGFLRDTATGVLALTTNATGAAWRSGFLRAPTGELVVTIDPTGAAWNTGFLRAPNGALVMAQDASGQFLSGFVRTTNGALAVTQTTTGAVRNAGPLRNANGLLVVSGLQATRIADLPTHWTFWHRGAGVLSEDDALRAIDVAQTYHGAADLIDGGDYRLTSGNDVVVMHDSTTGRTCTSSITVATSTLAAFQGLTMKARTPAVPMTDPPPTAAQWLDKIQSIGAVCSPEVKVPGNATLVSNMVSLITARGMQQQCLVLSTAVGDLAAFKTAGIPTGYIADQSGVDTSANVIAAAPDYLAFDYNSTAVTDAFLQAVAGAGIKLMPYTIDHRQTLAEVDTRLTGLGLTRAAVCTNDAAWLNNVSCTTGLTTDPFSAGLFLPGMVVGQPYHQGPIQTSRGAYVGSAGAYRLQLDDSDNPQWMSQFWAAQPLSATSSITVTITYDAIGTTNTHWAAVAFDCPTDRNWYNGNTAQNVCRGYAVLLRVNGSLELFKSATTDGAANTSLATAVPTAAITSGGTATLKIEPNLAGGVIKATRVDTGHSIQATDTTYRGGYFHFGKYAQAATGLKPSFSNVTIVP